MIRKNKNNIDIDIITNYNYKLEENIENIDCVMNN